MNSAGRAGGETSASGFELRVAIDARFHFDLRVWRHPIRICNAEVEEAGTGVAELIELRRLMDELRDAGVANV